MTISNDEVFDLKQTAEFLKISRQLVVQEIELSALPARKVGREWRISKRLLLKWLESTPDERINALEEK